VAAFTSSVKRSGFGFRKVFRTVFRIRTGTVFRVLQLGTRGRTGGGVWADDGPAHLCGGPATFKGVSGADGVPDQQRGDRQHPVARDHGEPTFASRWRRFSSYRPRLGGSSLRRFDVFGSGDGQRCSASSSWNFGGGGPATAGPVRVQDGQRVAPTTGASPGRYTWPIDGDRQRRVVAPPTTVSRTRLTVKASCEPGPPVGGWARSRRPSSGRPSSDP